MFLREFKVIDSAESAQKLQLRLKGTELEQYGEAFTPEYVYEVIRRLPRFAHMRVSLSLSGRHDGRLLTKHSVATSRMLKNSLVSCSPVYTMSVCKL